MTITESCSEKTVNDPAVVKLLLEEGAAARLSPFFLGSCSVTEAATQSGVRPNTMFRWVQRCCKGGILKEVGNRAKRGRPIKLYAPTAQTFFVPFAKTTAPTLEALLSEIESGFEARLRRCVTNARQQVADEWGYQVALVDGHVRFSAAKNIDEALLCLAPTDPAVMTTWVDSIHLTFEEAKSVQLELYKLFKRVTDLSAERSGTKPYLLRLGIAPEA